MQVGSNSFGRYCNEIRPHQAHGRQPLAVHNERDKAARSIDGLPISPTTKVRRDRIDNTGTVTPPYGSWPHHIGR